MMDPQLLRDVAREFADLDISAENAEIERLRSELAQTESRIVAAEERRTEIAREVHNFRGPNGQDVAQALLDGRSPSDAAKAGPNIPALEEEKEALRAGIRSLHHRVEDLRAEISSIEMATRGKFAPASQRLADALADDAKALIEQILPIYAQLAAVATTTRVGSNYLGVIRETILAANRLRDFHAYGLRISVPAEMTEVLSRLEGKGPALSVGFLAAANL